MSNVHEWISIGFAAALYAAFSALPLALLALAIDALAGRFVAAKYRCLLWILVAARLVMPLAPESAWSLQQAWQLTLVDENPQAYPPYLLSPTAAKDWPPKADWGRQRLGIVYGDLPARPVRPAPVVSWQSIVIDALPVIWFVGGATLLLRAVWASMRFARRLRTLASADDRATLELLQVVCVELGVRRPPGLKYVAGLSSPALFGVFRPTLCLPAESTMELSASQLRMIMLHELSHVRRCDCFLNWAVTVVQAAQWFNPVAWLATGRIALYREHACDEAVRQRTAANERAAYADLLLRFAAAPCRSLGLAGAWFARPVRHLRSRIAAMVELDDRHYRVGTPAAAAVLTAAAVVGLTDAASFRGRNAEPQTVSEWMATRPPLPTLAGNLAWWAPGSEAEEEAETRTYDLSNALAQMSLQGIGDDARRRLLWLLKLPTRKPVVVGEVVGKPNQIEATMTPHQHAAFADMLAAIEEAGMWQVAVEVVILRAADIEAVGNVDWQDAARFVPPNDNRAQPWQPPAGELGERSRTLSLSAESTAWDYSPYLALIMERQSMRRVRERLQSVYKISYPKVTAFSGSTTTVRDESQRPFVVGVNYIKGELGTAAQPQIATLAEGTTLDVQPIVVDAGRLDLRCRLAVSQVDGVANVKLPGQDVTVQNPRLSRKTITASCRVAPGETLLIAPMLDGADADVRYYAITAEWFPDIQTSAAPADH